MSEPRQLLNIDPHEFQSTLPSRLEMYCARSISLKLPVQVVKKKNAFHQGHGHEL
jgi:hypothetical protein